NGFREESSTAFDILDAEQQFARLLDSRARVLDQLAIILRERIEATAQDERTVAVPYKIDDEFVIHDASSSITGGSAGHRRTPRSLSRRRPFRQPTMLLSLGRPGQKASRSNQSGPRDVVSPLESTVPHRDIIAIGGSLGAVDALKNLFAALSADM